MAAKTIPDPGFAGDDGSANPAVLATLRSGDQAAIVSALISSRLLVPVTAVDVDADPGANGLRREKVSEIALVLIKASNGLTALPAFTSMSALSAWRGGMRPVPAHAPVVAARALAEGADLLVIDPSGPSAVALAGPALWALAESRPLLAPAVDPEVVRALRTAATANEVFADAIVDPPADDRTDLRLRLVPRAGATPADLQTAMQRVAERLAADACIRVRIGRGIEIVPP